MTYKGDTPWHLWWKAHAPDHAQEFWRNGHRADVVGPRGRVVEIQNGPISVEDKLERERAYGDVVWLFGLQQSARLIRVEHMEEGGLQSPGVAQATLRWVGPWECLRDARRPVVLDLDPFLPGFVMDMDVVHGRHGDVKRPPQLVGWMHPRADLKRRWFYPDHIVKVPFSLVRVFSGIRPEGVELSRSVMRSKQRRAWVTTDQYVSWVKYETLLSSGQWDWEKGAELLVRDQDVIVLVPLEINDNRAVLDGFLPAVMEAATKQNKAVYLWKGNQWYRPAGLLRWDPSSLMEPDWGSVVAHSSDESLRGFVKVERSQP